MDGTNGANGSLPYSEDAEKGVLCSLILGLEKVADLCKQRLEPNDFYSPAHRIIYGLLLEFADEEKPAEFHLIKGVLKDRGQLNEIGGAEFLDQLYRFIPTAANARYYIGGVKEKATFRKLILGCGKIMKIANETTLSGDELIIRAHEAIEEFQSAFHPNGKNPWVADLENSLSSSAQLRDLELKRREPIVGDWFKEGDLGFIFAPRGVGKTWLAIDLARGIASGHNVGPWKSHGPQHVLYIDGEMPADAVRERDRTLGEPCENLVYCNHEILFQRTGRILNLTNHELQNAILETCLDFGIKVLFLDNISTLVSGSDENKGLDWEMLQPWLLDLRRRKIAVVFIHHAGRNPREMRGHSKREDSAFWVIRLERTEEIEARVGAKFISRFTKCRNTADEPCAYEWGYIPSGDRTDVSIRQMAPIDVFKRVVQDGLCRPTDIAAEMGISKGYASKLAKKGEEAGWLIIDGGTYRLRELKPVEV